MSDIFYGLIVWVGGLVLAMLAYSAVATQVDGYGCSWSGTTVACGSLHGRVFG